MNQQQHQPHLTLRAHAHIYALNSRSYMTKSDYDNARAGVFEMEAPNDIHVQHDQLSKRIEDMIMNSLEGGGGQHATECPLVNQVKEVTLDHYHACNPYPVDSTPSNSYNPYPQDCSWSIHHQTISNMCQNPQFPDFQNYNFQPVHDQQIPQHQTSYMEELLENYIMDSNKQEDFQPILNQPILLPQKSRLEELLENFLLEHQKHEEVMEQQMQRLATDIEQMRANNAMLEHQLAQQVANYEEFPSQPKAILEEEVQLFALPWRCGEQVEAHIMEPALESDEGKDISSQTEEGPEQKELYASPPSYQPQLPFPHRVQEETVKELNENPFHTVKEAHKGDEDSYRQEEPQSPRLYDTISAPLLLHMHKSALSAWSEKSSMSKGRASQVKFNPLYSHFQRFCTVPGLIKNTTRWALRFCRPDLKAAADKRHLRLNE